MPLKGCAYLLDGIYADPGARFLTDIDLLIPEGAGEAAGEALARIGFVARAELGDYRSHHHLVLMFRDGDPAVVELHTKPVHQRAAQALPPDELWRDGERRVVNGLSFFMPSTTDAALLSFLHAELADRHLSRLLVPLKSLYDLLLLEAAFPSSISWRRNRERAARIGASRELERHLGVLARLSGVTASREGPRPSRSALIADSLHFRLCAAAAGWPVITRWVMRLDRWSGKSISQKTITPRAC